MNDLTILCCSTHLVDVIHQDTLVFEDVTLALHVKVVVAGIITCLSQITYILLLIWRHPQMVINLALLSVLPQQPPQDSLSSHP